MLQFKTKKQKYKCGHENKTVILDNNELSLSAYLDWKNTVGFEGDNSKCWECFYEEKNRRKSAKQTNRRKSQKLREKHRGYCYSFC